MLIPARGLLAVVGAVLFPPALQSIFSPEQIQCTPQLDLAVLKYVSRYGKDTSNVGHYGELPFRG